MKLLFINELVNSDLSAAIAWTLLHSTWQGMLAAILAGLIVVFCKNQSASFRYHLFSAVFIVFLISVSITFLVQFNDRHPATNNQVYKMQETISAVASQPPVSTKALPGINALSKLIRKADVLLHQYYPLLFSCWLLICVVKLVFMLTGFRSMNRLRRESTQPADIHWQNLVNRLSESIGITRQVLLLESSRIKVPMMSGFFKPVIFIPLGLCCHLPAAEIEAILLHELAHIRRSDYLMNLLQRVVETIFFFNPFILWLSSLIREERENCCDDMAVNVTRDKQQYIHALVAFQEYRLTENKTPALAFAGSSQRLLHRAKRLLMNENKKLNHMEKMILVCSMVALTAAFSISAGTLQAQNRPQRESQHRQESNKNDNQNDEAFEHVSYINSNNNGRRTTTITAVDQYGKKYVLRKTDGKVTRLVIDNKEIDENDYPEYKKIIEKIEAGSGKNQNINENNNNDEVDEDVQREMQLSREAERLAREHRLLETERMQQQRALDRQHMLLERQQQKNADRDEKLHLLEERIAQKIQRQREMELENEAGTESGRGKREMELHEKMAIDKQREQLREMELQQKIAIERMNDAQELLREHQKMEVDRRIQDEKIARNHFKTLMNEQREAQLRNKAQMDQMQKALRLENKRNEVNRYRIHDSIEEELRDLEHERNARERQLLLEKKMALREHQLQQNKNFNRTRRSTDANNEIESIAELLQERGVLSDADDFSFTLNGKELIVNGKRQSDVLYEEFKDRFIDNESDSFIYERNGNSTRTTINKRR